MMKLKKAPLLVVLFAVIISAFLISPAGAAARTAAINVTYGITLLFNESDTNLTDVNGKKVEPFVYQGTTYVPIRAVSELFGAGVDYNASTNTAYVYDDFSEACAIVYAMTSRASEALFSMDVEFDYAWSTKDFSGYKDSLQYCYSRLSKAGKAAETAGQDNANLELLDSIEYDFAQFTAAYIDTYNKFVTFDSTRTKEDYDAVTEGKIALLTWNTVLRSDADKFFDNYSCWRNLGMFDEQSGNSPTIPSTPSSSTTPAAPTTPTAPTSSNTAPSTSSAAATPAITNPKFPLHLYSYDGREYLGKLVTNKYDSDSIWNTYGTYGSKYQTKSIWNTYGTYGGSYSNESAFYQYASKPPKIVDNNGTFFGYLTTNSHMKNSFTIEQLQRYLVNNNQ